MFWNYLYILITAPGVMVHELAHAFFCWIFGLEIYEIHLLRFDEVSGYVVHQSPTRFLPSFFVSFGPLMINSALAMWSFHLASLPLGWQSLLYAWLGLALSLHAIPSSGDAKTMFSVANRNVWRHPLEILAYPFVLALYILNFLKKYYLDWIFAAFLFYAAKRWFS